MTLRKSLVARKKGLLLHLHGKLRLFKARYLQFNHLALLGLLFFSLGCTEAIPEFEFFNQSKIEAPANFNRADRTYTFSDSDPSITISGSCDVLAEEFVFRMEDGGWETDYSGYLDSGTDQNCSDGKFTLVFKDLLNLIGASPGSSSQKHLYLKGVTKKFKSYEASVTLKYIPGLEAIPNEPHTLSVFPTSSSDIQLSWSSGGGTTSDYRISYSIGLTPPADCSSGTGVISEALVVGTTHTVSGLFSNTNYAFRLCSINSSLVESIGITTSAKTQDAPAPNPTTPSAVAVSTSSIQLNWSSAFGSTVGFRISYQIGVSPPADCVSGTQISTVDISGTSHLVTGLTAYTQYAFRICSVNNDNMPSSGVTVGSRTLDNPALTPISFVVTNSTDSQMDLSWNSGGGSTQGYQIAYKPGTTAPINCSSDTVITSGNIIGTTKPITGLSPYTDYSFKICALNFDSSLSPGANLTFKTKDTLPPSPIGFMSPTQTENQIDLSWSSGGGSTQGYQIAYSTGLTPPPDCNSDSVIPSGSILGTSPSLSGFSPNTNYSFKICAINLDGAFSSAATLTIKTKDSPSPNPTNFMSTFIDNTQIDLTWNSGGGSTQGYQIAYKIGTAPPIDCASETVISSGSIIGTSHSVTGLIEFTEYSFRLCSLNADGSLSSGVFLVDRTKDLPAVDPNSPVTTPISSSQININWNDGGVFTYGFRISYQPASAPADCDSGNVIPEANIIGTSKSVTGLLSGTEYHFRLCALNRDLIASNGITFSSTTLATAPPNPVGVSITPLDSTSISLSWTSAGGPTTGYRISYQEGGTAPATCSSGNTIAEGAIGASTTYTVGPLSSATQYSFRVCAINASAMESTGETVQATTYQEVNGPPDVLAVQANALTNRRIDLSWNSGGGSTDSYVVAYRSGSAPTNCTDKVSYTIVGPLKDTTVAIRNLVPNTAYGFRVCAINSLHSLLSSGVTRLRTTLSSPNSRIFVSSTTTSPAGGVVEFDRLCREAANNLQPSGSQWRALVSSNLASASSFDITYPVKLGDSVTEVSTTNLWIGSLNNPIISDENSLSQSGVSVWTGTTAAGNYNSSLSCQSWTKSGGGASAAIGVAGSSGANWINSTSLSCNQSTVHLYCIETQTAPIDPPTDIHNLKATLTDSNNVALNWDYDGFAADFKVVINMGIIAPADCSTGATLTGGAKSINLPGLNVNQDYSVRVCADNGSSNSMGATVRFSTPNTPVDISPDAFTFAPLSTNAFDTFRFSNRIQITGISQPVTVSIDSDTEVKYRVCTNGVTTIDCDGSVTIDWTDTISTNGVLPGDYVEVKLKSGDNYNQQRTALVTIGTHSSLFNVNTQKCPINYVFVEGNSKLNTTPFCVSIYEMRNVASTPVSQPTGLPWVNVNQTDGPGLLSGNL